jgi:hypothetical protein
VGWRTKLLTILLLGGVFALPAEQAPRRILCDFRIDGIQGPVVKDASKLSLEVKRQVLSAVFPKYLTSQDACNRENEQQPIDTAKLEAERQTGEMVPAIEEFGDGSFTAPGRRQTAYFIKVGECFAYTRTYWGTYRLAIFEGPRLVANIHPQVTFAGTLDTAPNAIATAADVNNDGIDELLLTAIEFGQGEVQGNAWLVSLRGGELHTLREFDGVYDNPCMGMAEGVRVTASVIAYALTQFFVEQYEAPCKGVAAQGQVPALTDFTRVPPGRE